VNLEFSFFEIITNFRSPSLEGGIDLSGGSPWEMQMQLDDFGEFKNNNNNSIFEILKLIITDLNYLKGRGHRHWGMA
jgi:hypothetical protein